MQKFGNYCAYSLSRIFRYAAIWIVLSLVIFLAVATPVLGAPADAGHSAILSWVPTAQPDDVTVGSWNVYRVDGGSSSYTVIASVAVETQTYEDTSVSSGGHYTYVLTAVDTEGRESLFSDAAQATIPVDSVPVQPPSITTSNLPAATVGISYNVPLTANGGSPPYTWVGAGVPGLTVSASGLLLGTPVVSGTFTETVTATDSAGLANSVSLTLGVKDAPSTPTGSQLPPVASGSGPSGQVLYWTFDSADISNGNIADRSGNGVTGTFVGNLQSVAGERNQALSFTGSTSYVLATRNPIGFTHSLTLAAWIKTTNASRVEAIFADFDAGGNGAGFIFSTNEQGNLVVRIGGADLVAYPNVITDSSVINDGAWHHVAATISFELQTIQFYVDGKASTSTTVNIAPGGDGGSALQVGVAPYTGYGDYFTGAIDEVEIYDHALVASEIATVYQLSGGSSSSSSNPAPPVQPPSTGSQLPPVASGSGPSGQVLYWTFDSADISNGNIADRSGNGVTGTFVGNLQSVAGERNQALSFTGSTSYVLATRNPIGFTHSLTLAAWIKTTNASRVEAIFADFDAGGNGAGFIFSTNEQGNLVVRIGGADLVAYPNVITDSSVINDGAWHHVAATISFELQTIQFYVDGKASTSTTVNIAPGGDGGSALQVGVAPYTGYGDYFTGAIDEVEIYDHALVASEIATVYQLSGGSN